MSLIVQKFGGSSVADAGRLLQSAALIRDAFGAGEDVVAVVSAQGDATDHLLQKARELTPDPPPRELDALLVSGEQASAALTAMALMSLGVPAVSLNAWQTPIESEGVHGDARIASIGTERIRDALAQRRVAVVTGFQAIDALGDAATLGRGGSDYSAVALAAALDAARCVIYTDVDGVYTADPRLCPTARRLPRVSYDDMYALSHAGAQVLHDKCVALARERGVEPEVRACRRGSKGTRVCAECEKSAVVGVTLHDAVVTVVGEPSERRAREALEAAGIAVLGTEAGKRTLSYRVPAEKSREALCVVHDAVIE
ncbi:MAG: aspartate kinase [Oscillospiraceae bacterium]|nr:aspartate kinase [Oscillospiraceae bacterium]